MKKNRWQFYERVQREVYRKLRVRERPEAVVGQAGDSWIIFSFSFLVWVSLLGWIFVLSE